MVSCRLLPGWPCLAAAILVQALLGYHSSTHTYSGVGLWNERMPSCLPARLPTHMPQSIPHLTPTPSLTPHPHMLPSSFASHMRRPHACPSLMLRHTHTSSSPSLTPWPTPPHPPIHLPTCTHWSPMISWQSFPHCDATPTLFSFNVAYPLSVTNCALEGHMHTVCTYSGTYDGLYGAPLPVWRTAACLPTTHLPTRRLFAYPPACPPACQLACLPSDY